VADMPMSVSSWAAFYNTANAAVVVIL